MKYLIASNAAYDKIYFPDGSSTGYLPGGAGLHALTGIQLWDNNVQLVCGIGEDYPDKLGSWIKHNNINTDAFYVRDKLTPLNSCTYTADGDRIDKTVYGDEHYLRQDCSGDDLKRYFENHNDVEAVYTFRDDLEPFWDTLLSLKREHGFTCMWEINARICVPEKLEFIRKILKEVETFSINKKEAFSLFGVSSEEEAIRNLISLGCKMVLFRTGASGLYVILGSDSKFFPSVEKDQNKVIDVTGCGNSSSSASFYAWNEGGDINEIGAVANITSCMCLKKYSAMDVDSETRAEASRMLSEYKKEIER